MPNKKLTRSVADQSNGLMVLGFIQYIYITKISGSPNFNHLFSGFPRKFAIFFVSTLK